MVLGESIRFRLAVPDDAEAVAMLHATSWRRHYRGAYSDAFLDGDVVAEPVTPPGGVRGRLAGSPAKLRYAWSSATALRERV